MRRRRLLVALGVAAALAVAAISVLALTGGDDPPPPDRDADGVPDAEDPRPVDRLGGPLPGPAGSTAERRLAVGETGVDDGISFRVSALREGASIEGEAVEGGDLEPSERGKLVRADVELRGPPPEAVLEFCGTFDAFALVDEEGRRFQVMPEIEEIPDNKRACDALEARRLRQIIPFEIPKSARFTGLQAWNHAAPDDPDGRRSRLFFAARR